MWAGSSPSAHNPDLNGEESPPALDLQAQRLYEFVLEHVANSADAQAITEETLIKAQERLRAFPGTNMSALVFTIARDLIAGHSGNFRGWTPANTGAKEMATHATSQTPIEEDVPPARACRERLNCWVLCIARRLSLEEQIALLQSDVYGRQDWDGAAALRMSEASYRLLLHAARAHLRRCAEGTCAVAGTTAPCPCETNLESVTRPHAEANVIQLHICRVQCPLNREELFELRRQLLIGLSAQPLAPVEPARTYRHSVARDFDQMPLMRSGSFRKIS
jgi:DNA-directed RNA polymerase specialized sigma24 family protein